ncbi:MAG TPA: hypothetical protein VG929_11150 [Actinomycetota bacterium]|nr:hypothetical protein [Actinomycetota bacterium]
MKLYAEVGSFRTRQILTDLAVLVWVVVWIRIGFRVHDLVAKLAGPGREMEQAGNSFASNLDTVSGYVPELPFIGGALRAPFAAAADGGRALESAGQSHQDVVATLAIWLGVLLAAIPILYIAIKFVPGRVAWIREAGAATRLRIDQEDLQLFALRAIARRPLHELQRACADPAKALATGDYAPLADLELRTLGLRAEIDERPGR